MKIYKKGQILIIVLVLMTVVGIIIISTVNNIVKDTQSSAEDARYNTLYAMAEDLAIQFGRNFGNPANNTRIEVFSEDTIKNFLEDSAFAVKGACATVDKITSPTTTLTCYQCEVERKPDLTNSDVNDVLNPDSTINGIVTICDTPFVENAEVFKDEIIVFDVEGATDAQTLTGNYRVGISKSPNSIKPATASVALEITIDFSYNICAGVTCTPSELANTQISNIKRIVNYAGSPSKIFNTLNPINANYMSHNSVPISFTEQDTAQSYNYTINIPNLLTRIQNDTSSYISHLYDFSTKKLVVKRINQLRIKPYISPNDYVIGTNRVVPSIKINILNTNSTIKLTQGRTIEANIYEVSSEGKVIGSQALVISTVPAIKYPSFFDYVIKTDNIGNL